MIWKFVNIYASSAHARYKIDVKQAKNFWGKLHDTFPVFAVYEKGQ